MTIEVDVTIDGSKAAVWTVITDIENAAANISGIEQVLVLEKPESGLVGLRWRETRTLFGKTATEDMWITDAATNEFYATRAESHGCVYISTLNISGNDETCTLTMRHQTKPQTFAAKLLSLPMGLVFRGALRNAMLQDLKDIKAVVERRTGEQSA